MKGTHGGAGFIATIESRALESPRSRFYEIWVDFSTGGAKKSARFRRLPSICSRHRPCRFFRLRRCAFASRMRFFPDDRQITHGGACDLPMEFS